jgi:hypothetical protein
MVILERLGIFFIVLPNLSRLGQVHAISGKKSYIESTGTPVLYLEDECSTSTLARVKTRIEAFLEMIA